MAVTETIAIIGASSDSAKYGNRALKAWRETTWAVFPVNPSAKTIEGVKAYASVLDIPDEVTAATLYVPPAIGLQIADELIAKGVRIVYLNPGSASGPLRSKLAGAGITVLEECSIIASRQHR